MPTAKHAAIAAALVTIWSATPVMGQTTGMGGASGQPAPSAAGLNGIPGARASAVIRAIESEPAPPRGVAVDATELARARAAGEMRLAGRGQPMQVERIRIDEPVRTRAGASAPASTRSASDKHKRASTRNASRPRGKAEIAWSAPADDDRRVAQDSDTAALY